MAFYITVNLAKKELLFLYNFNDNERLEYRRKEIKLSLFFQK